MVSLSQPLVTVVMFSYNQEQFVANAVHSILQQDYPNLEIILSDDCSTDSTFEIMRSISEDYNGAAKILLNRNEKNMGLVAHFNKIMKMSKGEIIVVAAGDDISLDNRVSRTVDVLESYPDVLLVSFSDHQINEAGKILNYNNCSDFTKHSIFSIDDLVSRKPIKLSGASRGFRRSLYLYFGDLNEECPTEDTPYLLRALLIGKGYLSNTPGIYYRRHTNSLSSEASINYMDFEAISNQYMADALVALERKDISVQILNSMQAWWCASHNLRVIRKEIYENKFGFFDFLLKVLFSKEFSAKEKITIFRRFFKRKIKL